MIHHQLYNRNVSFIVVLFHPFAVVYGGFLYVFGGYNGLHDLHFDDVFKFDPGW